MPGDENSAVSVILVSQEEYDDLQAGQIELPDDWGSVADLEDVGSSNLFDTIFG